MLYFVGFVGVWLLMLVGCRGLHWWFLCGYDDLWVNIVWFMVWCLICVGFVGFVR